MQRFVLALALLAARFDQRLELDDRVRKEIAKWRTVIHGAGITPMKN